VLLVNVKKTAMTHNDMHRMTNCQSTVYWSDTSMIQMLCLILKTKPSYQNDCLLAFHSRINLLWPITTSLL